jgi:hypothetical protein
MNGVVESLIGRSSQMSQSDESIQFARKTNLKGIQIRSIHDLRKKRLTVSKGGGGFMRKDTLGLNERKTTGGLSINPRRIVTHMTSDMTLRGKSNDNPLFLNFKLPDYHKDQAF